MDRRYWEDLEARLDALWVGSDDPLACLAEYPRLFRKALADGNRMWLCGYMAAEHDDLPDEVRAELRAFADVQVEWLARVLLAAGSGEGPAVIEQRARAIVAAVGGAQVMARSRADIGVHDDIIAGYRASGLLPACPDE